MPQAVWRDRHDVLDGAAAADPGDRPAVHPLHVGTTGLPKGVVGDAGGHAVALAGSMGAIYDVHPGDVWWAVSDIGRVVGVHDNVKGQVPLALVVLEAGASTDAEAPPGQWRGRSTGRRSRARRRPRS